LQMIPRLENRLGWLLLASLGNCVSSTDHRINTKAYSFTGAVTFAAAGPSIAATGIGAGLAVGDQIVTDSTLNPGPFTVTVAGADSLTVTEAVVEEAAASHTLAITGTVAETGVNVHDFGFATDEADLPYVTIRKLLPHVTAAERLSEVVVDNHLGGLELNIPATGPMTLSAELLGRTVSQAKGNPAWYGDTATMDDDATFPLAVHQSSSVLIRGGGFSKALKATAVMFSPNARLLQPDQSRYIGSLSPLDFPVMGRAGQITVTAILEDWDLYLRLFKNGGSTLSATPMVGNFDIRAFSPSYIPGTTTPNTVPFGLQFLSGSNGMQNNVVWGLRNAVELAPQRPVYLTLVGTVQRAVSGVPYTVRLQNAQAAYTRPV